AARPARPGSSPAKTPADALRSAGPMGGTMGPQKHAGSGHVGAVRVVAGAPSGPPRDASGSAGARLAVAGDDQPAIATLDPPAVASDSLPADSWGAVIEGVNARKRMLGAFLQACRLAEVTATHLVLEMDDLHRAVVDEKEN